MAGKKMKSDPAAKPAVKIDARKLFPFLLQHSRLALVQHERKRCEDYRRQIPDMSEAALDGLLKRFEWTAMIDMGTCICQHAANIAKAAVPASIDEEMVNIFVEAELKKMALDMIRTIRNELKARGRTELLRDRPAARHVCRQ